MDFILDPSLVLYLPLYELDSSSFRSKDKHGHLATVTGALWTPRGRTFDGVDDQVTGGSNLGITGNAEFTIEAWIKMDTLANWSTLAFWGASSPAGSAASLVVMLNGNAGLSFGGGNNAHAASIISVGVWYHLVGTKTAGAIDTTSNVYLNGVLQSLSGASTLTPNIANSVPTIGGNDAFGFADCIIGEARIYSRPLTPTEIQRNYLATKWRYQ